MLPANSIFMYLASRRYRVACDQCVKTVRPHIPEQPFCVLRSSVFAYIDEKRNIKRACLWNSSEEGYMEKSIVLFTWYVQVHEITSSALDEGSPLTGHS